MGQDVLVWRPDKFSLDLDDVEISLIRSGIMEWGGPAHCTEELAVAMGFASVRNLFDESRRLHWAVAAGDELSGADWLRVLLLTEIAFASNAFGLGSSWETHTGMSDEESFAALRRVQGKLSGISRLLGQAFGTRPPRPGSAGHLRR